MHLHTARGVESHQDVQTTVVEAINCADTKNLAIIRCTGVVPGNGGQSGYMVSLLADPLPQVLTYVL